MKKKRSRKSMRLEADQLFRDIVRARGRCEAEGFDDVRCNGNLQTMHLVPRNYYSKRWDLGNAACGCGAHHVYFTSHPLAHERFCMVYLGDDMYEQLKYTAEEHMGEYIDYPAIIERLKGVTTTSRNH